MYNMFCLGTLLVFNCGLDCCVGTETTPTGRTKTGHGGNVGPAFKAFADFASEQDERDRQRQREEDNGDVGGGGGRARVKLISWYAGRESSVLAKELYGGEVGQHATPDEVGNLRKELYLVFIYIYLQAFFLFISGYRLCVG